MSEVVKILITAYVILQTHLTITENDCIFRMSVFNDSGNDNQFPASQSVLVTRSVHLPMWDRTVKYNLKTWEITRRAWFSLTCEKYIHSVKRRDKWRESEVQSLHSGLRHAKAPVGDPRYCLSVKASQFFSSDMVFFIVILSRDMTGCGSDMFPKEISTCWSYLSALMITLSNKCTRRHDMLTSILGTGSRRPIETLSF